MNYSSIKILKVDIFSHSDDRRSITDIVIPSEIEFNLKQVKLIIFSKTGNIVGNHYHSIESNRFEAYVAIGPEKTDLFEFVYRDQSGVSSSILQNGIGCLIPPGCTHSFKVIYKQAQLFGFSNINGYDSSSDILDVLIK